MEVSTVNNSQLCNQTSFNVELYTPPEIIEAARNVLGVIDLDPASSIKANKCVKAERIYTKRADGLTKRWKGNVWMNHPWGAKENTCKKNCKKKSCLKRGYHLMKDLPGNAAWINKLIHHYKSKDINQALCITYASTGEGWFKPLKQYPICFLDGRTSFYNEKGQELNQNTKGCAVTYLGKYINTFEKHFSKYGDVMVPASML